jgi:hypothetical protein
MRDAWCVAIVEATSAGNKIMIAEPADTTGSEGPTPNVMPTHDSSFAMHSKALTAARDP